MPPLPLNVSLPPDAVAASPAVPPAPVAALEEVPAAPPSAQSSPHSVYEVDSEQLTETMAATHVAPRAKVTSDEGATRRGARERGNFDGRSAAPVECR